MLSGKVSHAACGCKPKWRHEHSLSPAKKSLIVKKPKNHSFGLCDVCSGEEGGRGLQFTVREGLLSGERERLGVTRQDVVNWRNKLSKARDFENEKPRKIKG